MQENNDDMNSGFIMKKDTRHNTKNITLAGCIFIPYSSHLLAVSKRFRSAAAGVIPLYTIFIQVVHTLAILYFKKIILKIFRIHK